MCRNSLYLSLVSFQCSTELFPHYQGYNTATGLFSFLFFFPSFFLTTNPGFLYLSTPCKFLDLPPVFVCGIWLCLLWPPACWRRTCQNGSLRWQVATFASPQVSVCPPAISYTCKRLIEPNKTKKPTKKKNTGLHTVTCCSFSNSKTFFFCDAFLTQIQTNWTQLDLKDNS